jgi:hypothetical protein
MPMFCVRLPEYIADHFERRTWARQEPDASFVKVAIFVCAPCAPSWRNLAKTVVC